jgi:hypothetical protein
LARYGDRRFTKGMAIPFGELRATLHVEGRACAVHPIRSATPGRASGVVVHIRNDDSLAAATQWMPGRIAFVTLTELSTDCLRRLAGEDEEPPFAAVVLLADERDDLGRLAHVQARVPVVVATRAADRVWLRRAVHADLSVHVDGKCATVAQPVRLRRERHGNVRFGEPGTVRAPSR